MSSAPKEVQFKPTLSNDIPENGNISKSQTSKDKEWRLNVIEDFDFSKEPLKNNVNGSNANDSGDEDYDLDDYLTKQENEAKTLLPGSKSSASKVKTEVTEQPTSPVGSLKQKLCFVVLLCAMLAIASGGVAFKLFPDEYRSKPFLVSQWRNQCMLFFFIPLASIQFCRMKKEERDLLKNWRLWVKVVFAAIGVTMWTGTWAFALNYTTLTRAYLLNNCQPLILVIWNKITGKKVAWLHGVGVIIGIGGLILTSVSGILSNSNERTFSPRELIGDGVAVSGSVFACMYIVLGGKCRESIPALVYLAPVTLISFIIFTVASIFAEGSNFQSFIDWTLIANLPIIGWFTLITGLLGISLISVVLKFLPSLVISIVLLFEPIAASIMGIVMKVENNPSYLTWIGAALVTVGIIIVTIGYSDVEEKFGTWIKEKIRNRQKRKYYEVNA